MPGRKCTQTPASEAPASRSSARTAAQKQASTSDVDATPAAAQPQSAHHLSDSSPPELCAPLSLHTGGKDGRGSNASDNSSEAQAEDDYLTEYEKERAQQIARNKQRMAELQLADVAAEFSKQLPAKHKAHSDEKGAANKRARKAQRSADMPRRTSLRQRGVKAEGSYANGIEDELRGGQVILKSGSPGSEAEEDESARQRHPKGPLPFQSNLGKPETDAAFLHHLKLTAPQAAQHTPVSEHGGRQPQPVTKHTAPKLQLQERHRAKVTRDGTTYLDFRPSGDQLLLAAGDKNGNIALWDVDNKVEGASGDFDGMVSFEGVHCQYISGLKWAGPNNLITASYDGSIRLLDLNKEASSCFVDLSNGLDDDLEITAMDVQADLPESSGHSGCCSVAYVAAKDGDLMIADLRAGKMVNKEGLDLHNRKMNTLQMEPTGAPLLLSSSTDASAKVWDVRKLVSGGSGRPKPLSVLQHDQSCHAAHWAPDGSKRIVTTSFDNTLKIWGPSGSLLITDSTGAPFQPAHSQSSQHTTASSAQNGSSSIGGKAAGASPARGSAARSPPASGHKGTKRSWQGTIASFFSSSTPQQSEAPAPTQQQQQQQGDGVASNSTSAAASVLDGPHAGVNLLHEGGDVKGGGWSAARSIRHNNQTGRWVTPFRAVWGPACDTIYVGNMQRGVDVFDASNGAQVAVLSRPDIMTAIPSRIAMHPRRCVLAAATASGRVHMFAAGGH